MVNKRHFIWYIVFLLLIGSSLFAVDIFQVREKLVSGIEALSAGDLSGAESDFKYVLAMKDSIPDSDTDVMARYAAKAYYFLGDIYYLEQEYEDAIDNYYIIIRQYSELDIYPLALYKLGRTLVNSGKTGQGISILYDYLSLVDGLENTRSDYALYWIGRAYTEQANYRMAINTFEELMLDYSDSSLIIEVRASLSNLMSYVAELESSQGVTMSTNELEMLIAQSNELVRQRTLLEKISELLEIKQQLLELKEEKIELLADLRQEREEANDDTQ